MDQIQVPPELPHIIQVYQPTVTTTKLQTPQIIHLSHPTLQTTNKITYEQTIMSESLHVPISEQVQSQVQRQIVMSCQHTHQSMSAMQSQILQTTELGQPIQFTSHVILPQVPVLKQQVLVEGQQYFEQYNTYLKDRVYKPQCLITRVEVKPPSNGEEKIEDRIEKAVEETIYNVKPDNSVQENISTQKDPPSAPPKKRRKSLVANPSSWACNVRKVKHQRGEAYINRKGKYVPEKRIRNTKNCLTSCKFRCSEKISDEDRETIFKSFYSLNANEKKHFLLYSTERNLIKSHKSPLSLRKYSFKFYFSIRDTKYSVCKEFFLGTLAISQKSVYNVHLNKTEANIPKPDGRGLSETCSHAMPTERKDMVRKHIMSFKTVDSKPIQHFSTKKQYLAQCINVKTMYSMYVAECSKENIIPVKESMYRKIFKQEFNLHIKKEQMCCKCKELIKKEPN